MKVIILLVLHYVHVCVYVNMSVVPLDPVVLELTCDCDQMWVFRKSSVCF